LGAEHLNCTNLENITIPDSVVYISNSAFYGWTSAQTIYVQTHTIKPDGWSSSWLYQCNAQVVWGVAKEVKLGTYLPDSPTHGWVKLLENDEFAFRPPIGSWVPTGSYNVKGRELILYAADTLVYVFGIANDQLIYLGMVYEGLLVTDIGPVPHGTIYTLSA